jgi:hypothetical protein
VVPVPGVELELPELEPPDDPVEELPELLPLELGLLLLPLELGGLLLLPLELGLVLLLPLAPIEEPELPEVPELPEAPELLDWPAEPPPSEPPPLPQAVSDSAAAATMASAVPRVIFEAFIWGLLGVCECGWRKRENGSPVLPETTLEPGYPLTVV